MQGPLPLRCGAEEPQCVGLQGGAFPARPSAAAGVSRTKAALECRVTRVEPLALTTVRGYSTRPRVSDPNFVFCILSDRRRLGGVRVYTLTPRDC